MTEGHSAITDERDSARAGFQLGRSIRKAFHGAPADAVVVFASAGHGHAALLNALADEAGTEAIVGASSAGEFVEGQGGEGRAAAMGLRSDTMHFAVGLGKGVGVDAGRAATEAVSAFQGVLRASQPYRSALVMTDAPAAHGGLLVEELTLRTAGNYCFFGGGAGDDGRLQRTCVFAGRAAHADALAALEILSHSPVGVGVAHGWVPAGPGLRVTEAEGHRLVSLNGIPAVHALQEYAELTGQKFHLKDPMPFFLHNVIGIRRGDGYRLRAPLAVQDDGAILCAAALSEGSVVHVMKTTAASTVLAARQATSEALRALAGARPAAAFVFGCVATRLRMGSAFGDELEACARLLEPAGFVGCDTYGQIARAEGQSSGFHNCTAVVCALPQ
ncbi:FIST N-terminal domain-containing protein [Ramlibacter monticola]|uniref:FIST C-terminal domain-containing protein n=1 Tax=Ramlibacter monticola TaxID=1926872 RepID=A0A937CVP0_9BURK|nr:FIST N-terminal domain-containing protein [Ramlibacter monticola]MBL0394965.1 FIST C-terminal domain-containing protein [Ramlibacter monticola]